MPFYDGSHEHVDQYVETIDIMQHLVDNYNSQSPVKFLVILAQMCQSRSPVMSLGTCLKDTTDLV